MGKTHFRGIMILLCLLLLNISVGAKDELETGVTVHKDNALDGYILFAPVAGRSAYLIDYDGHLIRQWDSKYNILTAYLLDNGHVLMAVMLEFAAGATGRIEEYDWEGNLVWSFDYPDLHHDIALMPNGNILMTAWERFPREEILAMGLNPDYIEPRTLPGTDVGDYDGIFLDSIIEVNPDTNEIVWRWNVSDRLIQDYDEFAPNYGTIADFPKRINLNYAWLRRPIDRIHLNAIDYNPERDEIAVSAHYYSEIWIIDHSLSSEEAATPAGDLLYRWGNPETYGQMTETGRQLYLQHDAQWLNEHQIMIFNNGLPLVRPFSTVDVLDIPLDESSNYQIGTDTAFAAPQAQRLYQAKPRNSFYSMAISGAELLPEGHLLITDGLKGRIFEVNADGETIWEYWSPVFQINDASTRVAIFKARYYAAEDEAFLGRDLTASDEIALTFLMQ